MTLGQGAECLSSSLFHEHVEQLMSAFAYRAVNETGQTVWGTIEAESLEGARDAVFSRGLIPSLIREDAGRSSARLGLFLTEQETDQAA